ncbi:MAG: HTTM domain-containing protein, partial [Planctomycetaceae bacterium]|nr:HTTM domain-containing protein [Planctomycetaceae bacterium]
AVCVGWKTRFSSLAAMVLVAYIGLLDSIGTLTKYTCVSTHIFLLLALSPCGTLWSVDAWLERRHVRWPGELNGGYRRHPVWTRRLMQCFIGIVYFGAAITKMQTPAFFSGDQLYFWLITNVNCPNPLGEMMSLWPPILVGMGLGTIVWEIVFPFLCWRGYSKLCVLAIGFAFHILTIAMLGLVVFPLLFVSVYWAFLDEEDFRKLAHWMRRVLRRRPRLSAVWHAVRPTIPARPDWATPSTAGWAFAAICAVGVGISIEVEKRMDVYEVQRAEGRHQLQPMSSELAAQMVGPAERIQPEDQLLGFDVGTRLLGGMLANSRATFHHGDVAILQCSVVPPHGDHWVEVNLHDASNRMLHRAGQVMTREKIRQHFHMEWTEMYPPADYDLVLKIDGDEVSRRRVQLLNTPQAASEQSAQAPATAMAR